ncbi:ORF440 [White spot syndrome virus]|uniref:ORF440 n=1 Tax=White spot syndrome virus TaxID=342409 RepID=A0A2D3I6Z5_9VIRU|nr:ORF440 [White spot syndrome virus]
MLFYRVRFLSGHLTNLFVFLDLLSVSCRSWSCSVNSVHYIFFNAGLTTILDPRRPLRQRPH